MEPDQEHSEPYEPEKEKVTEETKHAKNSIQDKIQEKFEKLKHNETFDEIYQYAANNTRDSIAYVLLAIALILVLFVHFWGGLLIGLVGGIYFCEELVSWIKNLKTFTQHEGLNRCVVMGAVLLGFIIMAPSIFIGAAIAIGVRKMLIPD
ncbi:MAG: hypothetical protein Tsb0021_17820 [Chlamydiales bacterium]